jgi:hypothetical protein
MMERDQWRTQPLPPGNIACCGAGGISTCQNQDAGRIRLSTKGGWRWRSVRSKCTTSHRHDQRLPEPQRGRQRLASPKCPRVAVAGANATLGRSPPNARRKLCGAMTSPQYGQAFSHVSALPALQEIPRGKAMRRSDAAAENSISPDNLRDRIARQAAVVEILQRDGYPCEVRAARKMLKSLLAKSASTPGRRRRRPAS